MIHGFFLRLHLNQNPPDRLNLTSKNLKAKTILNQKKINKKVGEKPIESKDLARRNVLFKHAVEEHKNHANTLENVNQNLAQVGNAKLHESENINQEKFEVSTDIPMEILNVSDNLETIEKTVYWPLA